MRNFELPGRSAVFADNGMCATSHPLAASVALDTLRSGGSAVDAAIAGAILLGVCEPHMTGLGGDCFALVHEGGDGPIHAINASGRAPAGFSADALRADGASEIPVASAAAVTVPTAMDGFFKLSERFGRLGMDRLVAPAIAYFESGVPVAPRVAFDWADAQSRLQGVARELFLNAGEAPRAGTRFFIPRQAEALKAIAKTGRDGFYAGPVAEDMVGALRAAGGTHTLDDFANAAATWTDPVSGHYGDVEVVEHPPNGQGTAALLLLNILGHFDLSKLDPFGAERIHIEAEATKLAYDARDRFLADPDHMDPVDRLQDPKLAEKLAALIDPSRAMGPPAPITEAVHKDTIYITVVDKDRMAISLIFSIFDSFGSGIASPEYGILFHNRGAGFTLKPGHPNEAGPGKRPLHTILPGILKRDGRVETTFGVMGGQYQSTGHARFVTNLEVFGMDPQSAIDGPRAFAYDGKLRLEGTHTEATRAGLATLGHEVVAPPGPIGGAQAIRMHASGVLEGASDPRKDGCAIGY